MVQTVPRVVDTATHTEKRPSSPIQHHYESPDDWYVKQFPIVVAAKEWHVDKFRSSILSRKKKHVIVRIEIRRKSDKPLGIHGYRDLEEGSVLSNWSDLLMDGDVIAFNILKQKQEFEESSLVGTNQGSEISAKPQSNQELSQQRPKSGGSISTIGFKGPDERMGYDLESSFIENNWSLKYSVPISKVSIQRDQYRCIAILGSTKSIKNDKFTLNFNTESEAKSFVKFVAEMKNMHKNVAKDAMKKNMEQDVTSITSNFQSIDFMIEIISATDLLSVNRFTSDPFVVVKYGGETIHKTDVISKDLNPIWSVKTKSLFIFTLHPEDYYNNHLIFEVRDYETFTDNKYLGQAMVTNEQLLRAKGERMEMKLKNLQTGTDVQGYLAIRCRRATEQDILFLKSPYKINLSVRKNQTSFIDPLYSKQNPTLQFEKKKVINGEKHYFVRPMSPDKDQNWMTKEQIDECCREPSAHWIEAGSGNLIELFVEVLSCHDLPNLDRGLPTNKTDAFATLVCEDAIVTTEVIRDTLNPRFMPWTRRAFKFNVEHITSPLFIGVFDHDQGNKYDPIGRVTVPLQKFKPGTEYNLAYDLFNSALVTNRESQGRINIRLSVKWSGQRKIFFDAISKNEQFTVNIDNKNNYNHAKYTILGYFDQNKYNFKTLLSYVCEILEYQYTAMTIIDGLKIVFLWRGHYKMNLCCCTIKLPIHSVIMLCFGIVVTEYPQYIISVFFASIAWLMLGLLEFHRRRPVMWEKPPLYRQMYLRLLTGYCRPERIAPYGNMQEDLDFRDKEKSRIENYERETDKFWQNFAEDLDDLDELKKNILFKDAMKRGVGLDIFKKQLFPLQMMLGDITYKIRLIDRILSWDLMYVSFWITTFAILLSILTAFIWDEVWLWMKRIVIYGLLGPWIKIVDVFYFQKLERMSDKEKEYRENERKRAKRNHYSKGRIKAQIEREELVKATAMKEHLFGRYLLAIPNILMPERFPGKPRYESYAVPQTSDPATNLRKSVRRSILIGQKVRGQFIPDNFDDHLKSTEQEVLHSDNYNTYGSTT